ncbi:hypothetical protein BVRB_8g182390 [Beta vulgaris subsp. vulgaris]|uniref:OPA3-like protein n=1 Tax=Beta vulgaris subsp. vulgaris TaxID=3555 RepID=UPI00053FDB6F|nr:OPA3-like protein [Beta vulgaris subsp. vulgaris]KMT04583.1 hypothetical protein BVRB_8g182390 [Beta vulgaris subsp. vulgaris]
MVLPLIKLGTLALRTLSKPIATRLKQQAGLHPKFREFIISFAQANHRLTTTLQRRIYGHATDVEIRPLHEERAVQAASDLLGEMFIFMVAGAALIFEVQRNSKSEAKKEEKRKEELEALRQRDEALLKEVQQLKLQIMELEKLAKGRGIAGFFNFRYGQSDTEKSS